MCLREDCHVSVSPVSVVTCIVCVLDVCGTANTGGLSELVFTVVLCGVYREVVYVLVSTHSHV